jgi:hypothetical protein
LEALQRFEDSKDLQEVSDAIERFEEIVSGLQG